MTITDTLAPCPFCGGAAEVREWDFPYVRFQARCVECKTTGRTRFNERAKAIAAWNRRTPPTPAAEEREAVAHAIELCATPYISEALAECALSALAPIRAQEIAAARAEEQGYRHTQVAALKQVHAAEILAAEANERARALGQATEHINRLEAALRGLLSTVERLDISEGVCCCGDDMATHAEPMSCGHTPVDAGHYHHGNAIQQARDAIEHGAGK